MAANLSTSQFLLLHNIYCLALALHMVGFASKTLHKLWRGGDITNEDAIGLYLLLQYLYLFLYNTSIYVCAYHVAYGVY